MLGWFGWLLNLPLGVEPWQVKCCLEMLVVLVGKVKRRFEVLLGAGSWAIGYHHTTLGYYP